MKRLILLIFAFCLLNPKFALAYPTSVKAAVDLDISQALTIGDLAILADNRYLFSASGEVLSKIDLGLMALTSDQPPDLTVESGTDGNILGLAYIERDGVIYAAQADGDLLKYVLSNITQEPSSETIAADKSLSIMAVDTSGTLTIYILDDAQNKLWAFVPGSGSTPTSLDLKQAISNQTILFSVYDMVYVSATDEIYLATDIGYVIYISNGIVNTAIDVDSTNGDDLVAVAASNDGSKVYAVNADDKSIEIIKTSSHSISTPITVGENTFPVQSKCDIVVQQMSIPSGYYYGFVSGQQGITVFDATSDTLIDIDTTNDAGTYDPIDTTYTGYMIASTDGYIYMSTGGGELAVVTDRPYITISSVTYTDSAGATATALKPGGKGAIVFSPDEAGDYDVRIGGSIDESGTLAASGTSAAAEAVTVEINYNDYSTVFVEGTNTIFFFVTDSDSLTGRIGKDITVDAPPGGVTLRSTGFGNGRVYVTFDRLTASDMSYYNLYADTDAELIKTKTEVAAQPSQPASGSTVTANAGGLTNGTTYYIAVEGVDANGNVGTRSWQLADGTQASAVPQVTVGPAEMSGETGGCSLTGVDRKFPPPLGERVRVRGEYLFLAALLILVIALARRPFGGRSAKCDEAIQQNPPFKKGGQGRICDVRSLILLLALCLIFSAPSFSAERSSQSWSAELKSGFWMPTNSTTEKFFDKCCNIVTEISGGYLYKARYGVEVGVGVMSQDGNARGTTTEGVSQDTFNLFLISMETTAVWRMDYVNDQIVVPYIKGGFDYVFFRENTEGNITKGLKTGLHAIGGLQFLLEAFDSDESLAIDYGINDFYFVIEARYNYVNSFGKKGLNLSGPIYSAGFLFEF